MVRRGDFPAFYSAGRIVISGEETNLYRRSYHQEIQNRLWPELNGAMLIYAYPPAVALFSAPFALFSPATAKILFSLVMLLVTLWSLHQVTSQRDHILLSLLFTPLLVAIVSGQITALSILCCGLLMKTIPRSWFFGGVITGLWCFKPPFGLIAFGFLFLYQCKHSSRRERTSFVAGFVLGAGLIYLLSAAILGFEWMEVWRESVLLFSADDLRRNAHQMVSLLGVISGLCLWLGFSPSLAQLLWSFLMPFVLLPLTVVCIWRTKNLQTMLCCLPALILFFSPHALFYDLSICLPALLLSDPLALDEEQTPSRRKNLWKISIALFLIFIASSVRSFLFITPLAGLTVLFFVYPLHFSSKKEYQPNML